MRYTPRIGLEMFEDTLPVWLLLVFSDFLWKMTGNKPSCNLTCTREQRFLVTRTPAAVNHLSEIAGLCFGHPQHGWLGSRYHLHKPDGVSTLKNMNQLSLTSLTSAVFCPLVVWNRLWETWDLHQAGQTRRGEVDNRKKLLFPYLLNNFFNKCFHILFSGYIRHSV